MSPQTVNDSNDWNWVSDWFESPVQQEQSRIASLVVHRRSRGIFSTASWAELLYAVVDLIPAIVFFVLTVTLLAAGAGLAVIYIGLPVLAVGLLMARAGGHLQRVLAAVLLDLAVPGPGPIRRRRSGPIGVLTAILTDPGCWRAVSYQCLKILLAPFTFAFAVSFYAGGLGGVTYWIWWRYLPYQSASDGSRHRGMQWWPDYFVDTVPRIILLAAVGVVMLLLAPRVVRFFTTIDRVLIGSMLGGPSHPPLR